MDCRSKILITGSGGFLGSEIVHQCLTAGVSVRIVDRDKKSAFPDLDYFPCDICDANSLVRPMEDVECVVHAAGLAHIFGKSQISSILFRLVNEVGTANVARAAVEAGVRHFILISSVSVYGPFTQGVYDESASCCPQGPYAESKYQAELRAIEIAEHSGMALTILRLATLYGEGDPGNVARLMKSIDRSRFIWIGDGSNSKSLLHREDAARACLATLRVPSIGVNIYNVSAPPCTMHQVVDGIAAELGRRIPSCHIPASLALALSDYPTRFVHGESRFGTWHTTIQKWLANDVYDASKFEHAFGFQTKVNLNEGLHREVMWYREQRQ